ncbi:alpha/beta hydrolase [Martelella sp. HB161492]|uniref:alpha/beta hydrolase n=1 Tax=Martelella sp. HB161492 TaxID=2720726 RepID=UPI001AED9948|nr:alpha/beta hydrolase [Martelella sp. HB161492]
MDDQTTMADGLADGMVIKLWPDGAPGTPADFPPQRIVDLSPILFRAERELSSISAPAMTVFRPENPNGMAVIVAPGGGYSRITLAKEGRECAEWLARFGITTFVTTYRLPAEGHENGADAPLADAKRAIRLVRHNAAAFGIDPGRIGVLGASAGGHVMASLLTGFGRDVYQPVDAADAVSARPDFGILLYPVITMDVAFAHAGSRLRMIGETPDAAAIAHYSPDRNVPDDCPEVFMMLADDDRAVPADNAVLFYAGLRRAGVKAELHVFRDGGHGFGVERITHLPGGVWPDLAEAWMRRIGMLPQE